jgi:hypothetical protein
VLVVVYDGDVPPAGGDFIFYVPQKHFLIDKDETVTVMVQTNTDKPTAQDALSWINHNQELFTLDSTDRLNARVTAVKEGSGTLTIRDASGAVETVYISVSGSTAANNVSIATESIIVLSLEDSQAGGYTTRIIISGGNENGIRWYSGNFNLVNVMENGASCVLYPLACGTTDLTVRGYGFTKTIVVKVVETETEKQRTLLMNVDQRSFRLKKGETVVINPYYKVLKPPVNSVLQIKAEYDNKVVAWEDTGGSVAITAKNIGIEHITLHNSAAENEVSVVFEVDESLAGSVSDMKNIVYMTTDNPVIIMEPESFGYYIDLKLIGQYMGNEGDFKWSSNSPLITLNALGHTAFLSAGAQEGKAVITVQNDLCTERFLSINVIISKKYLQETVTEPYMYTERSVYTMNKNDSSLLIPLEIRNLTSVDYGLVQLDYSGGVIESLFANGNIVVNAVSPGTGIIKVRYAGLELKLYVVVQESDDNEAVYLTTAQNYVIINENTTRAVNVDLVNYTELDYTKISWKSDNTSVAHVIGSGKIVQVLGTGVGVTKITAQHAKSYNKLDIIVKVLPADSAEDICYLTTHSNVIETYVSTNSSQIMVNKVGGRTQDVDAAWSVDNPSILGVLGINNTAYITAKKAGVAKITVADREAGTLEIVVIVREAKPGSLYIVPSESIVQITPGSTNGVIGVTMEGINESDEKNFKWEIFSQLPSDINVARNGGNVVSIYSMGKRATVNGIYAGTARIRVTHPKAAEAVYIVVQVTNFQSLAFGQTSVDIVKNDMAYVTLETPDYENYAGKIQFRTDNPNVATVMGTLRVALVSAHDVVGKTTITAFIPDTDLTATLTVNIKEEEIYKEPVIVTSQTMFMLNPVEAPFYVSASLMGFGVEETDSDNLIWELNYTAEQRKEPIIKIFPENAGDNGFKSTGRNILVEVQDLKYMSVVFCTMTVSHPDTSHKRVLYFQIQEDSNAFTISTKYIQMETGDSVELSCNILNGTSKDYEQVVWQAKKDDVNPDKDIVKIMGRGKTIQLYATSDGYTTVTASFRGLGGLGTSCAVNVKSVYYFSISYQMITAYPGQKDQNGGVYQIKYTVRPFNAAIQWMNTDDSNYEAGKKIANTYYGAAENDGSGTGEGSIYFDFLKEGAFTLMGVSNHKTARVDIVVQNVFDFYINGQEKGNVEVPYMYHDGSARITLTNRPGGLNLHSQTFVKDKGYEIKYMVKPASSTVKLIKRESPSGTTSNCDDWIVTVEKPHDIQGVKGYGYIYIKNHTETPPLNKYYFTFQQMRPDGQPAGTENQIVNFKSQLPAGEGRLVPVFERIRGKKSNPYGRTVTNGNNTTEIKYKDDNTVLTGYPVNKDYTSLIKIGTAGAGEYLEPVKDSSGKVKNKITIGNNEEIKDHYKLDMMDGEEHYIILDKYNPAARIEEINMTITPNNDKINGVAGRGVSASLVALDNGLQAIKISGGKDFIIYDGFGTNYELITTLSSQFPNYDGNGATTYSQYIGISYNDGLGYLEEPVNLDRYGLSTFDTENFIKYHLPDKVSRVSDWDGPGANIVETYNESNHGRYPVGALTRREFNTIYYKSTEHSHSYYQLTGSGSSTNSTTVYYYSYEYSVYVYDYHNDEYKKITIHDYAPYVTNDGGHTWTVDQNQNPMYTQYQQLEGYKYKIPLHSWYKNFEEEGYHAGYNFYTKTELQNNRNDPQFYLHNAIIKFFRCGSDDVGNMTCSSRYKSTTNHYDPNDNSSLQWRPGDYDKYILTNYDFDLYNYDTAQSYSELKGHVKYLHPLTHEMKLLKVHTEYWEDNFEYYFHLDKYDDHATEYNRDGLSRSLYNNLIQNLRMFCIPPFGYINTNFIHGFYINVTDNDTSGTTDAYYKPLLWENTYFLHNNAHNLYIKSIVYNWGSVDPTEWYLHSGSYSATSNGRGISIDIMPDNNSYSILPRTGNRYWYNDVPHDVNRNNDYSAFLKFKVFTDSDKKLYNFISNKSYTLNKYVNNYYYEDENNASEKEYFDEFKNGDIYSLNSVNYLNGQLSLKAKSKYVNYNRTLYTWNNKDLLDFPFSLNYGYGIQKTVQMIDHINTFKDNVHCYYPTSTNNNLVREQPYEIVITYTDTRGITNNLYITVNHKIFNGKHEEFNNLKSNFDDTKTISYSDISSDNGWKNMDSTKYPWEFRRGVIITNKDY